MQIMSSLHNLNSCFYIYSLVFNLYVPFFKYIYYLLSVSRGAQTVADTCLLHHS